MNECKITFYPQGIEVSVERDTLLLEAVSKANISISNLCGGDGICGRCKMIVKEGEIAGEISAKLTRDEIKKGYVLACMTKVKSDLVIEIPEETLAQEKKKADKDADRFRGFEEITYKKEFRKFV